LLAVGLSLVFLRGERLPMMGLLGVVACAAGVIVLLLAR